MQVETRGGAPKEAPTPSFKIEYDPALPITAHRAEVIEAIRRHPVLVLCGATGSGKSTQLPKLCLEAGRGVSGLIGHTQPRRIAARALASRLAEETGTTVGGAIGYKVRFNDRTGPNCRVKLMTDGILLKELESDRRLRRYDTLIIDEAHERSLNIDLLLGVLKQLLPQRPDLRLIVTSATIDPGKFADFFGGAPIIEVSGRSYPVEVRYRPLIGFSDADAEADSDALADSLTEVRSAARSVSADEDGEIEELSLPEGILRAVRELDRPGGGGFGQGSRGDVLVFLPGEKQIREAAEALEKARLPNTEVLPLFARLSSADQERIFQRHSQRRVVLATNVAETSLTVPGIRFVIDSGLARISRYSVRGKVQRLPIERISKASADQRKGRCGREAEGICIRLYPEEDFTAREEFTPPEVLRTNLASVILRMAALGLGDPESFPFLDPPDTRLVNDGVRLLQELKAMDQDRRVTSLGQQIAGIPVDPRLGRMLLAASRQHCLTEMLVVASFLEVQDPRERPTEAQQQASEKHALFADPRSDFVTVLNVWRAFNEQSAALSRNQLRKWCREHFLSFMRMREWQDLHGQLVQSLAELKLRANQMAASYTDLHQAILTGFLGSIGELDEKREYNGPRGVRFVIAPGTPLASKPPRWIVAGSIVETTRLYARMVAAVDPGWIEAAGAHLLKRSYSEPHWVHTRGFVSAYESVALYGLTLAAKRRVNYGAIAPAEARDIFVREALVETKLVRDAALSETDYVVARGGGKRVRAATAGAKVEGDFLEANRCLQAQVEALEAKIRRRDVLVDEESLVRFYAARIPERVNSVAAFNHWRVQEERSNPRLLYMSESDLMRREVPEASAELFPDEFPVGGNALPLIYKFEPAEPADGVTLVIPEPLLDVVHSEQIAWLVPGMRLEKVTAIFRALPKGQRKLLVPVPDHAKAALEDLARDENRLGRLPGFHEWLAQWVTQQIGASVSAGDLAALELPEHLRMNLRVLDAEDRVIAEGRDLLAIKRRVYGVTVASGVGSGGGLSGGAGSHGGAGRGSAAGLRGEVGSGGGLPGGAGSRGGVGRGGAAGLGGEVGSGGGLSGGAGSRGVVGRGSAAGPRGEVSGGGLPGSAGGGAGYGGRVGSTGGGAGAGASEPLHKQWDFGELPETRQVERNRLKLVVYPALEDRVSGVAVVEARNAHAAQEMSRAGMVRLAMLVLPQQAKFVSKRMADDRDLVLLSRGLSLRQSLAEALTQRAFRECFFPADVPLPRDAQSFSRRLDESRARLSDLADRLAVTVTSIFREWRAARAALDNLSHPAFADAASDIEAQLRVLLPPDFLESTPQPWLDSLPRYLKAINRRLERLRSNQRRDSELTAKVKPFSAALRGLMAEPVLYGSRAEIDQLRWMIEEFRVSLFAQELKTLLRVSEKRLAEQLDLAQQSRP